MTRPLSIPRFVHPLRGRQALLHTLVERVARPGLTTVWGTGGIGKSRLASEIASTRRRSRSLVAFVALQRGVSLTDLASWTLGAAEVPRGFETRAEPIERLRSWFQDAEAPLLVLDEAEHAPDVVRSLVASLGTPPRPVHVLVTSRVPLGVEHEELVELAALDDTASAELFRDAAPRGASIVEDDLTAIVGQLGGLPLAIELAAARLELLPPRELARRLDRPMQLLRLPEGAGRGETLWHSMDATWQVLDEPTRRLALHLALFDGDIRRDAAEALAPPDIDVAAALDRLAAHCLVRPVDGADAERLRRVPFLREFLAGRLEADDERAFFTAHAEWFAARSLEENRALLRGEPSTGLGDDEAEVAGARERCLSGQVASRRALLGCVLGSLRIGRRSSAQRLALCREALRLAGSREGPDDLGARAWLEAIVATELLRDNQAEEGRRHLDESLRLARAIGDLDLQSSLQGIVILWLGAIGRPPSEHVDAFREALTLSQEADNRQVMVGAMVGITLCEDWYAGWHPERSLARLDEAARWVLPSDLTGRAVLTVRQGLVDLFLGHVDRAERHLHEAERLAHEQGSAWRLAEVGFVRGICAFVRGDLEQARARLEPALGYAERAGWRDYLVEIPCLAALVAVADGRRTDAERMLERAEAVLSGGARSDEGRVVSATVETVRVIVDGRSADVADRIGPSDRPLEPAERVLRALARVLAGLQVAREREGVDLAAHEAAVEDLHRLSPGPLLLFYGGRAWAGRLLDEVRQLARSWQVDPDDRRFVSPHGESVQLRRDGVAARLFAALAQARLESPGRVVPVPELVRRGWPEVDVEAGRNRLYVTLTRLRRAGLSLIEHHDGGYRLDPTVPVRRAPRPREAAPSSGPRVE